MNVGELLQELRQYPPETPVVTNIVEGTGFELNWVGGLLKDEKLCCVAVGHVPPSKEDTWNKDQFKI